MHIITHCDESSYTAQITCKVILAHKHLMSLRLMCKKILYTL